MSSPKLLSRTAVLRLLCFLLAGGLIGAAAAVAPNRAIQYALICLAIVVGIYAGFSIRTARKST